MRKKPKNLIELKYYNIAARIRSKSMLTEQRYTPSVATARKVFVEPFENVFKSLKLAAMDLSNVAKLIVGTLVKLDSREIADVREKFADRQSRIRKEWSDITEKDLSAIKSADPFFVMLITPTPYLATMSMMTGFKAGKTAIEILASEDLLQLIDKFQKYPTEKMATHAIINKLEKLFYEKKSNVKESLLREQDDTAGPAPKNAQEWLDSLFEETGLDEVFAKTANDVIESKLELAKVALELTETSKKLLQIANSKTPSEFAASLKTIEKNTNDFKVTDLSELKSLLPEMKKDAEIMTKSKDFREIYARQKEKSVEDISDEEYAKAAHESVFNSAKVSLDEVLLKSANELAEKAKDLRKEMAIDEMQISLISNNQDKLPAARDLISVYQAFEKSYKSLMSEFKR